MGNYTLEELEYFLKDEEERADRCNDEDTKHLLLNRCEMWKRLIKENYKKEPVNV